MFRRYYHVEWSVTDGDGKYLHRHYTVFRTFPWQGLVRAMSKYMWEYKEVHDKNLVPEKVVRV